MDHYIDPTYTSRIIVPVAALILQRICHALRSLFCCNITRVAVQLEQKLRQSKDYLSWKLTVHDKVFHENQKVHNFCWDFLASHTEINESVTQGMNERMYHMDKQEINKQNY